MDQNTFTGLLGDFQQHCSAENNLPDVTAFAGHLDAPVVVLVHGIGGNAQHWSDPVSLNPNDTWLFDLNATPTASVPHRRTRRAASHPGRKCCNARELATLPGARRAPTT